MYQVPRRVLLFIMAIARLLFFSSILGVVLGNFDPNLIDLLLIDTVGDPTDWISVNYVISKSRNSDRDSTTLEAEKTMVLLAHRYANGGPFSMHAKILITISH